MAPAMQAEPFQSARLVFRAIEEEDDPFLQSMNNDHIARMNAYCGQPKPSSKTSAKGIREWLAENLLGVIVCLNPEFAEEDTRPPSGTLPITTASTGFGINQDLQPIPIGWLGLMGTEAGYLHHRETAISITLHQSHRGHGYGREAIEWALDYSFGLMGLHRVCIGCVGWNDGARRLYASMGFELETIKRKALWFRGRWWDDINFGMLEDEWRQRRSFDEQGLLLSNE